MSQTEDAIGTFAEEYKIARCFHAVIVSIEADVNFRLPDTQTDPASTLTEWLNNCRGQLEPLMIGEASREFVSPDRIRDFISSVSYSNLTNKHNSLPTLSEATQAIEKAWDENRGKNGVPYISQAYVEPLARIAATTIFEYLLCRDAINNLVNIKIWPLVEHWLRSLYIRYQAAGWVRQYLGDATILGTPDYYDSFWYVPLGIRRYGMGWGQVVLDANGSVIPDRTSTREQILAKINDRELPATPAEIGH